MKHLIIRTLILSWLFAIAAARSTPSPQPLTPDSPEGLSPQRWEEIQKLTSSDAAEGDNFGYSVSASADTIIAGAPFDDDAGPNAGAAYIFERNQGGLDKWGQVTKLTAFDAGRDKFGDSVAINGDTIVVGAPEDDNNLGVDSGAAYVFQRDVSGNWTLITKLTGSESTGASRFGDAVAISGDTIVVGASTEQNDTGRPGSAYIFERNQGGPGNWVELAKLSASDGDQLDFFGQEVAVSADTVIIGAHKSDSTVTDSGAVYVFERNQGGTNNWGQIKLTASDAAVDDQFGTSVAISGDTIIVGARFDDAVGSNAGSAYVFQRDQNGNWIQVTRLNASDSVSDDRFGTSVSISGDSILVGAENDGTTEIQTGSAYIFGRNKGGTDQWGEVTKLTASDATIADHFGWSVYISTDSVVVGAIHDDDACPAVVTCDSGSVYVFHRSNLSDLFITMTDSVDPATAGNLLTYTITVQNFGPDDAQDVVVTETLPAGVAFVSTIGCAEDPTGAPTCTLGTIASGDFDAYTITVTVDSATTGTITNQAAVNSSTPEALPGNENVSEETTIAGLTGFSSVVLNNSDWQWSLRVMDDGTFVIQNTNSDPGIFMSINSKGNIGIGSTTPDPFKLLIKQNANNFVGGIAVQANGHLTPYKKGALWGVLDSGEMYFGTTTDTAGGLAAATKHMSILPNGNIGINTVSPAERLQVSGAIRSTAPSFNFAAGDAGIILDHPAGRGRVGTVTGSNGTGGPLEILVNNGVRIKISETGNTGVGTEDPRERLEVSGAVLSTAAYQSFETLTTYSLGIDAGAGTTGSDPMTSRIVSSHQESALGLWTANAERLRISSDGKVGIGTQSPVQKLDVAGAIAINGRTIINGSGQWVGDSLAATTFAVCSSGKRVSKGKNRFKCQSRGTCNCNGGILISKSTSPCTVTSDTGSCSASTADVDTGSLCNGECCVCVP